MGHAYHLWAIIRRLCLHTRSTRNSRVSNGERKWHSNIIAHSQLPFASENVYSYTGARDFNRCKAFCMLCSSKRIVDLVYITNKFALSNMER